MTTYKDYRFIIVKREIYNVGQNAEPLTAVWQDWGFSGITVIKNFYVKQQILCSDFPNRAKRRNVGGNLEQTYLKNKEWQILKLQKSI